MNTDTHLRVSLGTNLKPQPSSGNASGAVHIGKTFEYLIEGGQAWEARFYFAPAALSTQSAEININAGTITLSATGTRQVETATVTALSGATANGNLPVTVTAAGMTGSPLTVQVPLRANYHTSDALIAQAIREKLATVRNITQSFSVVGTGNKAGLKAIFGKANDGTLNIAIAAGLGVAAQANSANTTAGVAGVILERLGGDGKNALGEALSAISSQCILAIENSKDSGDVVTVDQEGVEIFKAIEAGGLRVMRKPSAFDADPVNITAGAQSIVDVIVIGAA